MQFDARAANLLQPGQHIIVGDCPGLRLEASATRKTWIYRYKSPVDGRMRQIKIGHWKPMSVGKAVSEWERLRDERDAGRDPAMEHRQARTEAKRPAAAVTGYPVSQLIADYMAGHVAHRRKPASVAEMHRVFRRLAGPLNDRQAADLTRTEAFEFLEKLADTPVQAKLIRQELAGAWDYALDAGRLPGDTPNWWRLVMRGRLRSKGKTVAGQRMGTAKRVLSDSEVGELIRWLPNFSPAVADLLTLYLWTGCRGGELVQIERGEVADGPDGLWWTCPKAKTKNAWREQASDLRVPLVGRAAEVVKRRLADPDSQGGSYLFPSERKGAALPHRTQHTLGTAVNLRQPYCVARPEYERSRLPVTHWAPHDLRRTVRTMLAALGCESAVAEAVLGHMQPGVQGIYDRHRYDKERRQWLTRLAEHLELCAAQA